MRRTDLKTAAAVDVAWAASLVVVLENGGRREDGLDDNVLDPRPDLVDRKALRPHALAHPGDLQRPTMDEAEERRG